MFTGTINLNFQLTSKTSNAFIHYKFSRGEDQSYCLKLFVLSSKRFGKIFNFGKINETSRYFLIGDILEKKIFLMFASIILNV